ncbi:MAG: hypothetical protein ACREGD_03045 [Candidatus Saccharimonadales bacterium]
MDVSAPRPPASPVRDALPVRPAPLSAEPPKAPQQLPAAPVKAANPRPQPAPPRSGAPVGVITIAVLAMMLLSAAAVVVYATSQTA